jgi:single-stranded-DNA-specific exonuclease
MLEADPPGEAPLVLSKEGWNQGVAGIVASRLAEKYSLPAVIISVWDGTGKGSCRSVFGFNVFEALDGCRELLLGYGGHCMAAGLSINEGNIPAFKAQFRQYFRQKRHELRTPTLRIDFEVHKPELLSVENVTALNALEPFGTDFHAPIACFLGVATEAVLPISDGRHIKFWVKKDDSVFECVAFNRTAQQLGVARGAVIDVAFVPRINEFRGRRSVQLSVIDVRI